MLPPFFFRVIPTYGVLPYAMIMASRSMSLVIARTLAVLQGGTEGSIRPPKPPGELRGGASGADAGGTPADAMLCSRYLHGHG